MGCPFEFPVPVDTFHNLNRYNAIETRIDKILWVPLLVARVALGAGLGIVLGMAGLGIAWGLYIFSGAVSQVTLLAMSVAGVGIGAGIGPGVAWLRLDRSRVSASFMIFVLGILGGTLGGWLGYQYGAGQEVECCAGPDTAPFTYTAYGATLGANAIVLIYITIRETIKRISRPYAGAGRESTNV